MWNILIRWTRNRQSKQSALAEALAAPLPVGAEDTPLEVSLSPWFSLSRLAAYLGGALSLALLFNLIFGFAFDLSSLLLLIGYILLAVAGGLPALSGLFHRLYISGEGIRLEKIFRTLTLPWWQISRVEAKSDLSFIRALGDSDRISIDCRSLPPAKRKDIIIAIRARLLPQDLRIEEWPREIHLISYARSFIFGTAGLILIFVASGISVSTPVDAPGHALGLRCGVSSDYLQERFGLTNERGCVILRVSGAAKDAGLQKGDLIIEMNGIPITSGSQFTIIFENSRRTDFEFRVIRPGHKAPLAFPVTLGPSAGPFQEDPSDPLFYYLRAKGDAERLHIRQDIADYSRSIELAPDFDLAYLYRGVLYEEIEDNTSALRDYMKAIELSPDLGEAYSILAYLLNPDDIEGAMSNMRKAIRLHECEDGFREYNVDCAVDHSLLARLEGYVDLTTAIAVANQAIEFFPAIPGSYFELANAYELLGDMDKAREYARRYLELAATWPYQTPDSARVEYAVSILESGER